MIPKKHAFWLAFNAATLLLCAGLLYRVSTSNREKVASTFVAGQIATLLSQKTLLEELRQGHVTNVIELLEQQLDAGMLILSNQIDCVDPETKELGKDALDAVHQYRSKHSRASLSANES